jgi:ketosteroid isomerase-like protein
MNRWIASVTCLGALALAGCTAADTSEADAKALRDDQAVWGKDWGSKDLEKIVAHYANDASVEIPDVPILTGKDAIRAGLKGLLADPAVALSFETVQVDMSKGGDMGYVRGTYSMTVTDEKTKMPVTEKGKFVTVYKKQGDGSWKAVQDINNPDAPAK